MKLEAGRLEPSALQALEAVALDAARVDDVRRVAVRGGRGRRRGSGRFGGRWRWTRADGRRPRTDHGRGLRLGLHRELEAHVRLEEDVADQGLVAVRFRAELVAGVI